MSDAQHYAVSLLLAAVVGLVAVLSNRLTARARIPVPVLVLVASAIAVKLVPALHAPAEVSVERILTVALVAILFDGGMHIGWRRFRVSAAPIAWVGVLGTFLTAGGGAVLLHLAFGLSWYLSLLVATAVAPTDPAVVFSVLGQREVAGRSGTILEGESGANDPVGIALMSSLLTAGSLSASALGNVGLQFLLQMVVGAAIGFAGGRALLWFMRRISLPSEGLYPLRTLASALVLYGVATLAHGSGFLAVFLAGIVVGDARAPFKLEVERFHTALASLAEIVAFVALGLTVSVDVLRHADVWVPGLVLAVALALVIRPVLVGLCLLPARLRRNERRFVLFAGLKGAVPLLLGNMMLATGVHESHRLYGVVVVVVIFSVLVQGTATPAVANALRVPMRPIDLEPWAMGVRLRDEPQGIHRLRVAAGAPADGRAIGALEELPDPAWVSVVVRDGTLVLVTGDTELHAGDEVLVLGEPTLSERLREIFEGSARRP